MRDIQPYISIRHRGSSLVLTLLIVTVMSMVVVALMQGVSVERTTSRSYANITRAELAAKSGVIEATMLLKGIFENHPESVTTYAKINDSLRGTVAVMRPAPNAPPASNQQPSVPLVPGAAATYRALISGSLSANNALGTPSKDQLAPPTTAANSVDLNNVRGANGRPLIGGPPGTPQNSLPTYRVPWTVVEDADGNAIARYAFLIEDESFKVNLNTSSPQHRGIDEISQPRQAGYVSFLAPLYQLIPNQDEARELAENVAGARAGIPFYNRFIELSQINRSSLDFPSLEEELSYVCTTESGGANLSRHGSKRVNLNAVITDNLDGPTIKSEVERIRQTILYHLPNFGQRFYRTGTNLDSLTDVTPGHATLYTLKLAANIKDFIDADRQPTVINNDSLFSVRIGPSSPVPLRAVGFPIGGSLAQENDVAALGKEAVPLLLEYAIRARTISMNPARRSASLPIFADYEITIDHYFKFWNMTTKPISLNDLGSNPFIRIYAQPAFDTAGGTIIPEGRDLQISLADLENSVGDDFFIPAGQVVTITTDFEPSTLLCPEPIRVFRPKQTVQAAIDGAGRRLIGRTQRVADGSPSSVNGWFRVNLVPRSTSITDYNTEVVLGNDFGLLESHTALPIPANLSINNDNDNRLNSPTFFFRGGSLRGTSPRLNQAGDPRTNNEQIFIQRYRSTGDEDQTRYYTSALVNGNVPANSDFRDPYGIYTDPGNWPDRHPRTRASLDLRGAVTIARDGGINSIGELGHVFDPARAINPSAGGVSFSRGGGRTLRIGQSDTATINNNSLTSGNRTGASREWAAWRLTDIFSVHSDLRTAGLINPNGILRDEGLALSAALFGMKMNPPPNGDFGLQGADVKVQEIVKALLDKLFPDRQNPWPDADRLLWERGEISELSGFSSGTSFISGGLNMNNAFDRGREEIARRLIDILTPKGDTYLIHCVGQAVQENGAGELRVLATQTSQVRVKLTPVFGSNPSDAFDPTDFNAVSDRFQKPIRYEVTQVP